MKGWETTLISPGSTIREVIACIDGTARQVAHVINGEGILLGVVTDGDVRRAILHGDGLEDTVEKIMNTRPITVSVDATRETVLALMKSKKVHSVPVINSAGKIVRVEFLDDLIVPEKKENWTVLMAGGMGQRLRPLTESTPKPLLQIGKKPLLQIIIENFLESGFYKFFISVNYKAEMIERYFGDGSHFGAQIQYLREEEQLGTAGALGLLPFRPERPLIVMNGDILTRVNFNQLLDQHIRNRAAGTMCIRDYDLQVPYGVVNVNGQQIQSIEEKPMYRFFINAGIYVLEPDSLNFLGEKFQDMPDFFRKLAEAQKLTNVFPIREYWLDIGNLNDFHRANGDYSDLFEN